MPNVAEQLAKKVQDFQRATGEDSMVVVVEKDGGGIGIHRVGFDVHFGLLVDGKPPTVAWHQEVEDFRPLEVPPTTLH